MVDDGQEREQPEQSGGEPSPPGRERIVRISFRLVAPVLLALLAALAWALTILTAPPPPAPSGKPPVQDGGPGQQPAAPPVHGEGASRRYEEATSDGLASSVRMIDMAIIGALKETGQGLAGVHILEVRTVHSGGEPFHVQTLELSLNGGRKSFLETLGMWLARTAPEAVMREAASEVVISVRGQVTHHLVLEAKPLPITPIPAPTPAKARLAIVIDDLGQSATYAGDLARLGFPVAFAIWPLAGQSKGVAAIAAHAGMDVLLHQPMEPRGYPETDPGRGALFIRMDEAAIRTVIAENLAQFPGAVGVNNHMGSRFTEDRRSMRFALAELRGRGLFYLDSVTTAASVAQAEASRMGIPALRRDVFLDNVADVDAIILQLRKAERLAIRNGRAVAIGHPYPETLQALRRWSAMRDERVIVVSLSSLLDRKKTGAAKPQAGQGKHQDDKADGKAGPGTSRQGAGQAQPARQPRPAPEPDEPKPLEITPLS